MISWKTFPKWPQTLTLLCSPPSVCQSVFCYLWNVWAKTQLGSQNSKPRRFIKIGKCPFQLLVVLCIKSVSLASSLIPSTDPLRLLMHMYVYVYLLYTFACIIHTYYIYLFNISKIDFLWGFCIPYLLYNIVMIIGHRAGNLLDFW